MCSIHRSVFTTVSGAGNLPSLFGPRLARKISPRFFLHLYAPCGTVMQRAGVRRPQVSLQPGPVPAEVLRRARPPTCVHAQV